MGPALAWTPLDFVYLFFNLQRLEVIKLGVVRLELGVEPVLAALFGAVALEKDHAATAVARGQVVACLVKLDGRDDVGLGNVFNVALVAKALGKLPGLLRVGAVAVWH